MTPELGVIEGFYGKPWSWDTREAQASFLKPRGYDFYLYAPKADAYLRKRWREDHPAPEADRLARMAAHCRAIGMRFGVGLSPYEAYRDFGDEAKAAIDAAPARVAVPSATATPTVTAPPTATAKISASSCSRSSIHSLRPYGDSLSKKARRTQRVTQ